MRRLELSPRLAAIAEQVPQGARLADVGTDHAYLPAWLLLAGRISGAVATDVREGPLQRGRETARLYKVEDRIVFRCCDGLAAVEPQEADTVVIAGMGGELMARIVERAPWTRGCTLLLQPMSAQEVLRQWLVTHGYCIQRETLVREGEKFYGILTATGGESPAYTLAELWAGRQRRGEASPHRLAYLEEQIRRRERALAGMAQGKTRRRGDGNRAEAAGRAAADEGGVEPMATVKDVWNLLDRKAPFRMQMDFDNAGFLVGRGDQQVTRVLVALDITPEVIREAAEKGCQLILAHHPVIWGKVGQITDETATGRKVLALIEQGIAAICAHTNLDAAEGGVNTALALRLGLRDQVPLAVDGTDEAGRPYGVGRVGQLEGGPMTVDHFARRAKETLGLSGIRVLDAGVPVQRVAVGGGACGSMLPQVRVMGCDTFLTADLKHDLYLEAREAGMNLLDAGHYSTEAVVCPVIAQWVREAFPDLWVEVAENQGEVFEYF